MKAEKIRRQQADLEFEIRLEAERIRRQQADLEFKRQREEEKRQKDLAEEQRWREQEFLRQEERRQKDLAEERRQREQEFLRQSEISHIKSLGALELEKYTAELFQYLGYKVQLTPRTGDHGVDVQLINPQEENEIAQCKQWSSKKVSERDLREFYGTVMAEKSVRGYLIAPHGFTTKAKSWSKGKPIILADANWLCSAAKSRFT